MSLTRIYLALTRDHLEGLAQQQQVGPPPLQAHAVTEAVRRAYGGADEEELEYAALGDASEAAAATRGDLARIVVAAADVDDADLTDAVAADAPTSTVRLAQTLPLRRIASFHVEEDPATPDEELLWYDVTELAEVIRLATT